MNRAGKRLLLNPDGQISVEAMDVPDPGPGQILVRVTCSQVSAGSEMNGVKQRRQASPEERRSFDVRGFGYTTVGRVEAVGEGITDFEPGDRVFCFGNHASHVTVTPAEVVGPIPVPQTNLIDHVTHDDLSDAEVCFAMLGDVALHGVRRAQIQIGESVAVHGLGVIGLLAVQLVRWSGAHPIIGVDIVEERLDQAKELGASHVVNAAKEDPAAAIHALTELPWRWQGWLPGVEPGSGAEVQLQYSSNIQIYNTMLKAAADRGRLAMIGATQGTVEINAHELMRRELTVIGSYQTGQENPHPYWPWTRPRNRQVILGMIARGQLKVQPLISHVVPYTEAPAMFDMMAQGTEGWMSIFFDWADL